MLSENLSRYLADRQRHEELSVALLGRQQEGHPLDNGQEQRSQGQLDAVQECLARTHLLEEITPKDITKSQKQIGNSQDKS